MKKTNKLLYALAIGFLSLTSCSLRSTINIPVKPIDPTGSQDLNVNKHHVVFLDYFDNVIYETYVDDKGSVPAPTDKAKDLSDTENFYKFTGFEEEASNVTSDLTIKATYDVIPYVDHYAFSLNEDGGYTLESFKVQEGEEVVEIPTQANMKPITKIGEDAFVNQTTIKEVKLPDTIKEIMGQAFAGDEALTTINLPEGLTDIGDQAFKNCIHLQDIEFPSTLEFIGNNAFEQCQELTSLTLPDSLKDLGQEAFKACLKVSFLSIGAGLRLVGESAFYGLWETSTVTVSPENKYFSYDGHALYYHIDETETDSSGDETKYHANGVYFVPPLTPAVDTYNVKEGTETIYASAFGYVKNIKKLVLPKSLKADKGFAYIGSNIEEIDYPVDGNITFSDGTFSQAEKLTKVTLPNNLTEIPAFAFEKTKALKSVTLPDSVETINNQAFYESGLESIVLPKSLTSLATESEDGNISFVFQGSTNLIIPSSVTYLGLFAFQNSGVKEVTIQSDGNKSLRQISKRAFYKCKDLTKVVLGNNTRFIQDQAFYGCDNLNELHLPSVFKSIGASAIVKSDGTTLPLKDIYYNGTQEEFAKITIDPSNNFDATQHNIHFAA